MLEKSMQSIFDWFQLLISFDNIKRKVNKFHLFPLSLFVVLWREIQTLHNFNARWRKIVTRLYIIYIQTPR